VPIRGGFVDCNSREYTTVLPESGYLPILVSCDGIEQHLEGFRVTFKFGNPHAARFSNIRGQVGYGETWPKAFEQAVRFSLAEMNGGSWNRVDVTINPATAKDVRYIRVDFSASSATMTSQ
jgi:hypothetical protein